MLRAFDGVSGTFPVLCALMRAPLLFIRSGERRTANGERRTAQWANFDLENAEWRYLIARTKTGHGVPLASQAVAIQREPHALTGPGRFVFAGACTAAVSMSDAAINAALRRLGYGTRTEIIGQASGRWRGRSCMKSCISNRT